MKVGKKRRPFSKKDVEFVRGNYRTMTDEQIGQVLKRSAQTIRNFRSRHGLITVQGDKKSQGNINKIPPTSAMEPNERKAHFTKEVKASAVFKALTNTLDSSEQEYYVEKYTNFMSDPTIETMTSMEKDALHQLIINEIRINRYMKEEKDDRDLAKKDGRIPISRSREIRDCEEIIMKCHTSLNVERKQRLKDQSDQSITFTNLIKDLKNPTIRNIAGKEAAMLKYMGESFYNDRLSKNIISGQNTPYDISKDFKGNVVPDGLSSNFIMTVQEMEDVEREKEAKNDQPTSESPDNS